MLRHGGKARPAATAVDLILGQQRAPAVSRIYFIAFMASDSISSGLDANSVLR